MKEENKNLKKQIEILKGIIIETRLQKYCYCDRCVGNRGGIVKYQKELRKELLIELEKQIQKKIKES